MNESGIDQIDLKSRNQIQLIESLEKAMSDIRDVLKYASNISQRIQRLAQQVQDKDPSNNFYDDPRFPNVNKMFLEERKAKPLYEFISDVLHAIFTEDKLSNLTVSPGAKPGRKPTNPTPLMDGCTLSFIIGTLYIHCYHIDLQL